MFGEDGDARTIELVDVKSRRDSSVHGDTPMHAYLGKVKYIGDRVWVVPNRTNVRECPHLCGDLVSPTVGFKVERFVDVVDVG